MQKAENVNEYGRFFNYYFWFTIDVCKTIMYINNSVLYLYNSFDFFAWRRKDEAWTRVGRKSDLSRRCYWRETLCREENLILTVLQITTRLLQDVSVATTPWKFLSFFYFTRLRFVTIFFL